MADYLGDVPPLDDRTLARLDAADLPPQESFRLDARLGRITRQMRRARQRWEKKHGLVHVEPPHLPY